MTPCVAMEHWRQVAKSLPRVTIKAEMVVNLYKVYTLIPYDELFSSRLFGCTYSSRVVLNLFANWSPNNTLDSTNIQSHIKYS